jgi:hypothetical protein
MKNFKDQIRRDIADVFHNTREFAEMTKFTYGGNVYNVSAVLDYTGAAERKKPGSDHAEGLFAVDLSMYLSQSELGFIPKRGMDVELGDSLFRIVKVEAEEGEIILRLEALYE